MRLYSFISILNAQLGTPTSIKNSKQSCKLFKTNGVRFCLPLDNKAHVAITEFKQINWLPVNYRFRQCFTANIFTFFDNTCPLYMKEVFDKPCISQASTTNSTMKLSQPLRRTNNGQHCISFLAPSVWNK